MDDGVVLVADRYAPPGTQRAPTVLVRSPYGRAGVIGFLFGRLLAERGLQVVVQSIRGTFASGGTFDPFHERDDGLATLRWLREQPWHEGAVGMLGPSYLGIAQWAIADEIDAMAPSVTASQFRGMAYGNGAISLDTALSWMLILELQERRHGLLLLLHGLLRTLPGMHGHLPIADTDEHAFGAPVAYFREWIEELAPDSPYWAARDFSSSVGAVEAEVQLTGGWYDIFLPWMIADFHALRAGGRAPQLIIGPWAHTSAGLLGVSLREAIAWLRAHLLDDRRMLRDTPVRVYVTGGPGWRDLADWPPPGSQELTLHLQPGGGLAASPPPALSEPSRYRYDPADPTPALGGAMLLEQRPVRDNRPLEARSDVLTFTTDPLDAGLEAIGPVHADIRLRSSLADTDVFVRVCDVQPGGASLNVCDALRAPHSMRAAARRRRRRRRARGAVAHRTPLRARPSHPRAGSSGAHPRYARNPGTGEDPVRATRLVAADQEIHHDASRPSSVTLTVLDPLRAGSAAGLAAPSQ